MRHSADLSLHFGLFSMLNSASSLGKLGGQGSGPGVSLHSFLCVHVWKLGSLLSWSSEPQPRYGGSFRTCCGLVSLLQKDLSCDTGGLGHGCHTQKCGLEGTAGSSFRHGPPRSPATCAAQTVLWHLRPARPGVPCIPTPGTRGECRGKADFQASDSNCLPLAAPVRCLPVLFSAVLCGTF